MHLDQKVLGVGKVPVQLFVVRFEISYQQDTLLISVGFY